MSVSTYKAKKRRGILLLGLATIGAVLAAAIIMRGNQAGLPTWLSFGLLVLVVAGVFWAMKPWWNGLDDMQKDAQYQSWYWGGTFGGTIALVGLLAFTEPRSSAAIGAMIMFAGQLIGYIANGIYWRIKNGGGGL